MAEPEHRCGLVAIIGRPNVGKSTLLNRLLGQKIAIVTPRPQTTRQCINGIVTTAAGQVVFVDTPGLHDASRNEMNREMNRAAATAIADVDLVLVVFDAFKFTEEDEAVLRRLESLRVPVGAVVNKVDLVKDKSTLLPFISELAAKRDFAFIIPLSAKEDDCRGQLLPEILPLLPIAAPLYPEDQVTDRSERFLASETVREKLFLRLDQEVPYGVTVDVERFEDGPARTDIDVVIWVDRPGHKPIVIGRGGAMLREVGRAARLDLKRTLGRPVHLKLWVKVRDK